MRCSRQAGHMHHRFAASLRNDCSLQHHLKAAEHLSKNRTISTCSYPSPPFRFTPCCTASVRDTQRLKRSNLPVLRPIRGLSLQSRRASSTYSYVSRLPVQTSHTVAGIQTDVSRRRLSPSFHPTRSGNNLDVLMRRAWLTSLPLES